MLATAISGSLRADRRPAPQRGCNCDARSSAPSDPAHRDARACP